MQSSGGELFIVQSSNEMAERLGHLALMVRTRLREVLATENEEGPIHKLMSIFRENLISDLDTDAFSDMFAQTIAYGLLSARIINTKANMADAYHTEIPITNPFLRDLMDTFLNVGGRSQSSGIGLDFDKLGINEVVDLLDNTNMEAVLRDFGKRNQKEDPVVHFFEGFLREYDSKIRKERGVFYTPQPVVSFIVRSVDEQLRSEFGLKDGLADTTTWGELAERMVDMEIPAGTSPDQAFVQILDPATGTGTFPLEVIDFIYKTMTEKWRTQGSQEVQIKELWNEYVPKHLLPRLHGYELMMAPYAIAHMKIGLKLYETGYGFKSDERVHIYLTNALEPAHNSFGASPFAIQAISDEVEASNRVKRDKNFTVVIGNPPYSKISSNLTQGMRATIDKYRYLDGVRIKERGALQFEINLQDDYVKFFRFFERMIEEAGVGLISVITNNGYLSTPTLRGMRRALMNTFSSIKILDLHGHIAKGEIGPNGKKEENVFDIVQGTSIFMGCRSNSNRNECKLETADIYGSRNQKYKFLSTVSNIALLKIYKKIIAEPPFYLFAFRDLDLNQEWQRFVGLTDLFIEHSAGVITGKDGLTISTSGQELTKKIASFSLSKSEDADIYAEFGFSENKRFSLKDAQENLQKLESLESPIREILYRPFDKRLVFYDRSVIWSMAQPISDQMAGFDNLALLATRQVTRPKFEHVFVATETVEIKACSHDRNTQIFPLFIKPAAKDGNLFPHARPNISAEMILRFSKSLGMKFHDQQADVDLNANLSAVSLFRYVYSILHSDVYRDRYFDFLRGDFPRVPVPQNQTLFLELAAKGEDLIRLHTIDFNVLDISIPKFHGPVTTVGKVGWTDDDGGTVWLDGSGTAKNYKLGTSGVSPVPRAVWEYRIGGYQVCEKWLKDRGPKKGRPGIKLTEVDIERYQKIIISISETIRIKVEVDDVICLHGGWPDAFITADQL